MYKQTPELLCVLKAYHTLTLPLLACAVLQDAMSYLVEVSHQESLYLKHTRWKQLPFSEGFKHLLSTSFSPCTICEHFASDASPVVRMREWTPSPAQCSCLSKVFDKYEKHLPAMPFQPMLAASGVDAVFVLSNDGDQGAIVRLEKLQRQILRAWGVEMIPVPFLAPSESTSRHSSDCLKLVFSEVCKLWACGDSRNCQQHLLVALLAVRNGLSNVLVINESSSLPPGSLKNKWEDVLRRVPADYDFVTVDRCQGTSGALCAGAYLMSQNGARRALSGIVKELRLSDIRMILSPSCGSADPTS
mmetsp:Transcript_38476/g.98356  ORF Transcript_38476/g.98356 Transcript_38476/m.98356 type:complete len:303 (+) Transcript_38476:772-1680(+)